MPVNPPMTYTSLVDGAEGVQYTQNGPADLVHLFCHNRAEFEGAVSAAMAQVNPGGMLWVSWPKKSSRLYADLTEQDLRDVILPMGWVDVKVCAVTDDWSGLKFVKRKTG